MINVKDLVRVIHLSPARQNQICFRAEIKKQEGSVEVTLKPTMDFFDQGRTVFNDNDALYSSMVFHTGMAVGSIEQWCLAQGLTYERQDNINLVGRNSNNLGSWFASQRDAMIGYMVGWIEQQRSTNDLFKNYSYDVGKCHRDFTLFHGAVYNDLNNGTDTHVAATANMYWSVTGEPVSRRPQETSIHNELRRWVTEKSQVFHPQQTAELLHLYDLFLNIIEHGARPELVNFSHKNNDYIRITVYE
jgi:hypothetical protein